MKINEWCTVQRTKVSAVWFSCRFWKNKIEIWFNRFTHTHTKTPRERERGVRFLHNMKLQTRYNDCVMPWQHSPSVPFQYDWAVVFILAELKMISASTCFGGYNGHRDGGKSNWNNNYYNNNNKRERERESMGVKGGQFVFKSRSQYRIHSLGLFLFVRVELWSVRK